MKVEMSEQEAHLKGGRWLMAGKIYTLSFGFQLATVLVNILSTQMYKEQENTTVAPVKAWVWHVYHRLMQWGSVATPGALGCTAGEDHEGFPPQMNQWDSGDTGSGWEWGIGVPKERAPGAVLSAPPFSAPLSCSLFAMLGCLFQVAPLSAPRDPTVCTTWPHCHNVQLREASMKLKTTEWNV